MERRAGHANTSRRCCRSSRQQTGIDVNLEVVNYAEMHTKLVPQLVAPTGQLLGDRGRLLLGRRVHQGGLAAAARRPHQAADKIDTSVYVPTLMDLVGKVDGVTYMLPFYNYAMGLLYRKDLLDDDEEQGRLQGAIRHRAARARRPGTNI